jgi:hypothetical protein
MWRCGHGHITKSGLSDGHRAKFLPLVVALIYNPLQTEGYSENVG